MVLLTPLVVFPHIYAPFQNAKKISFMLLVELLVPVFLYLYLKNRQKGFWRDSVVLSFAGFFLALVIASAFGIDPWNSFLGNMDRVGGLFFLGHVLVFIVLLRFAHLRWGNEFIYRSIDVLVGGAALVCVYALFEYVGWLPTMAEIYLPRVSSVLGNPAYLASFLIIPFFLALHRSIGEKKKYLYLGSAGVIFLALLASGTRAALLGVIVGAVIGGLVFVVRQSEKKKQKKLLGVFVALMVLCSMAFALTWAFAPDRSLPHRLTHFYSETSSQRLNYWSLALTESKSNLILGLGFDNFYKIADTHYSTELYELSDSWPDKPHNHFLDLLTSGGVVTLLAYFVMLFFVVRAFWKKDRPEWFLAALVAYLANVFFMFETVGSLIPFALLLSFAAFSTSESEQEFEKPVGVMPISMIGAIVVLVSIVFVLLPYYGAVHAAMSSKAMLNESPQQAVIDATALNERQNFLLGPRLVPEMQFDVLLYAMQSDAQYEHLAQLFDATEESFEHLVAQRPLRARHWDMYAAFLALRAASAVESDVEGFEVFSERALEVFDHIKQLAPDRVEWLVTLSHMYQLNGDTDEAIVFAEEAVEKAPGDAEALGILGQLYLQQERFEEAQEILYRAIDNEFYDADHAIALWLIMQFSDSGRPEELLVFLNRLIEMHPDEYQFYEILVGTYLGVGDVEKAVETAKYLLEISPNDHPLVEQFLLDQ